jgi:hypothetical protein
VIGQTKIIVGGKRRGSSGMVPEVGILPPKSKAASAMGEPEAAKVARFFRYLLSRMPVAYGFASL